MAVKAVINRVRISPRKVGEVAAMVRGRSVSDAMTILEHTPRRSAKVVKDAISSAQANATHNHNFKPGTLNIVQISVTAGVRYKRFRPAARGRALPFERKTSNISVIVDGEQRVAKKKTTENKETK